MNSEAEAAIRRLILGVAILGLLGGCAAAAPTSTPTVSPASPTAAAWTPAATPAAYGPVTVVEGISTFVSGDIGTQTSDPDGARHSRGGTFVFDEVMNDPRVSGRHTVTNLSMDYWGDPNSDNGALVQWGDELIENDGGTWEGWASGIYSTDRGDLIAVWFEGTGGYVGLSYFYMADSLDVADGMTNHWRVRGQIFPGTPPVAP